MVAQLSDALRQRISIACLEFERSWTTMMKTTKNLPFEEDSVFSAHKIISYNPTSEPVSNEFPKIKKSSETISKIIQKHSKLVEEDLNNVQSWILLGHCYLVLNDFPNAYSSYSHVHRITDKIQNPYFWYCSGIVYQHFRYNEEAIRFFAKVIQIAPKFPEINDLLFHLSISYRQLSRYEEGIGFLQNVLAHPPANLVEDDINFQIAFTYQCSGLTYSAYQLYAKLYAKYPRSDCVIQQFLWFLSFQNADQYLTVANDILNNLSEDQTTSPVIKLISARIAMKQQNLTLAYQKYCECSNYWCESPLFWCGLGILYFKSEQYEDAKIAFQRAIGNHTDIPEAWLNLGYICESTGDHAMARKIYETGAQQCSNTLPFQERIAQNGVNYYRKGGTPQLMEIDEPKFALQTVDIIVDRILDVPPKIPAEQFEGEEGIAEALEPLVMGYDSLFSKK
ncbi:TPR Domain containing protein [Histomonas meleagridis]|uniref:TPR Domain containing protein n=1 Tax=Histomonas meleagridis TaxID=135588 RepID=UPI00355AC913|nr:TPR Domain containing protein [Histomonas meleagridis]KAH0798901.1 TPR Domain containing protein [Histomonas meleagridis]